MLSYERPMWYEGIHFKHFQSINHAVCRMVMSNLRLIDVHNNMRLHRGWWPRYIGV